MQVVEEHPGRNSFRSFIVAGLLLLFLLLALGFLLNWVEARRGEDRKAAWEGLWSICIAAHLPEGYWTGDVAGLFERGKIPREIAEADSRPLKPLVDRPHPYHGYLFVALESGPGPEDIPISLKGVKISKDTCAFCAYPMEKGANRPVYLVGPSGQFRKVVEDGIPVLEWPKDLRKSWWIVD